MDVISTDGIIVGAGGAGLRGARGNARSARLGRTDRIEQVLQCDGKPLGRRGLANPAVAQGSPPPRDIAAVSPAGRAGSSTRGWPLLAA